MEEPHSIQGHVSEEYPSSVLHGSNRRTRLSRIFGPITTTSMRLLIINTVISIFTMNFFTFPLFFRTFGLVFGTIVLGISNLANWWACRLILEASDFTGQNSLTEIIERMFGPQIKRFISISFFLDYFSNYVFLLIQSWVCFEFVLAYLGLLDSSALIPGNNLEFSQYHPEIFAWRFVFLAGTFLFYTPVFMRDSYETVKCITIYCSVFWFCFVVFLVWDFQHFRNYYAQIGKLQVTVWASPSLEQIRLVFMLLSSLYIQTSLMTMKGEIANPNLRRMLKSSKIAYIYTIILAFVFGVYFYCCLGDLYTSDVFMVRKSFTGKPAEGFYVVLVAVLCLLNLAYIKFYHGNMKGFILVRFNPKRLVETYCILPWAFSLIFVLVYPKVLNFYGYSACTVFLLNGYILPLLMKRKILKAKGYHWIYSFLIDALLTTLVVASVISLWTIFKSESTAN